MLVDTGQKQNEGCYLRDLDGDGVPEFVVNSWNPKAPLIAWQLNRDPQATPTATRHELAPRDNSHGMGFGDVNGDDREDILVGTGWFEQPVGGPFSAAWKFPTGRSERRRPSGPGGGRQERNLRLAERRPVSL